MAAPLVAQLSEAGLHPTFCSSAAPEMAGNNLSNPLRFRETTTHVVGFTGASGPDL